jgi:hypothetical protein
MTIRADLRKNVRKPFVSTIKYSISVLDMGEWKKIHTTGISVDISEGGLGMLTDYPLKAGDMITLDEEIEIDGITVRTAIVKWSKQEGGKYRVGLGFII